MTKGTITETERRHRFRLARLAELDERIRQNDYADDLHNRKYRILKERLDVHHEIDATAASRLVGKAATRKTNRLQRARINTCTDLEIFEQRLGEVKPNDQDIDYLVELKNRRDRQNIDNRRRQKRLEKIICDRDQEALLREKRERWSALDVILKQKPSKEAEIDSELDRIAIAIRKGISSRQYHEQELRRIQARAATVALSRDLAHQLANRSIYEHDVSTCLTRIRECGVIDGRRAQIQIGQECQSLVIDLISMAVDIANYKHAGRCNEMDSFLLDQWKAAALYRFSHRTLEEYRVQGQINASKFTYDLTVDSDLDHYLNRRAMRQYTSGLAPWWKLNEPTESEVGSEMLGASVDRIVCAAVRPPTPQPTSQIRCPVVCVIGKPFAGKTSLSKALGQQLGYLVVDVNASIIQSGIIPSNDTDYIKLIEEAAAKPDVKGVVLDGFPFTIFQAESLQNHLSGVINPIVERNGLASRFERSDIVPYPDGVPHIPRPPFNGSKVSAVLNIHVDDKISIRRCLCRRIDPLTGDCYSIDKLMLFDVPVKERLVQLPKSELFSMTLPENICTWNSQYLSMSKFFKLFNIFHAINGNNQLENITSEALSLTEPNEAERDLVLEQAPEGIQILKEPEEISVDYLDEEVVARLYGSWVTMESAYISHLQRVLRDEISSYMPAVKYIANVVDHYQRFVERYDERQLIVDKATAEYNEIDYVIRTEDIVKAELHERVQNLETSLLAVMENKRKENESEFKRFEHSEWFQKQLMAGLERCLSLLQAELSRHQMMVLFFGDIESCRGARPPSDSPIVTFRADSVAQSSTEPTVPTGKKGTTSSNNAKQEPLSNTLSDSTAFMDSTGKYSASRVCEFLQLAAKNASDLATAKDPSSEPPLVKYERILTRNRIKRILSFGIARMNRIKNDANRVMDLLKSAAIQRQQSEITCCKEIILYFRKRIEEETPMLHPIQIVSGISLIVNESQTIYDSKKDIIPSLFEDKSPGRTPLY